MWRLFNSSKKNKEQIQVRENWQENVVTALSDPTAVGISNINEWEEFLNLPITSSSTSVPHLHSNNNDTAENIQNTQVSVDRRIDEIATNSNDKK